MNRSTGLFASVVLFISLVLVVGSTTVLAQVGDDYGDDDSEYTVITDTYGLEQATGSRVSLQGTTNADGWRARVNRNSCAFSEDLLWATGVPGSESHHLLGVLIELGIITDNTDPILDAAPYTAGAGFENRFSPTIGVIGGTTDDGRYNCINRGLYLFGDNCSWMGEVPASIQVPATGMDGYWILTPDPVFLPQIVGGLTLYRFSCVELYDEPAFTAAVLDQTDLVIPKVTLEARVRAAVGAEIGAWYTVSDTDIGRDRFQDELHIGIPTLADSIPVDAYLWLEQIRWDLDADGNWDIVDVCAPHEATEPPDSFDCGGTEAEPIGAFMYEYRGLYDVTVELQWDGYFIAYIGDGDEVRGDLDSEDLITPAAWPDYPVIEIRSSLDG